MRTYFIAIAALAAIPATAMAQSSTQEKARLETQCSQNPASEACRQLRRELPPTTTGTVPGPGNPNRPGAGGSGVGGGEGSGVSGAGAGGVTPQGNPSAAGGGTTSSSQ